MENIDSKTILFNEYNSFAKNPMAYFSDITIQGINIIAREYKNYDKEKVLRQMNFIKTFILNLENLSSKNITKILIKGAIEKHLIFLLIYSKIAIFIDLIENGIFETSHGYDKSTKKNISFKKTLSESFNMTCEFFLGFIEKYNDNLTDYEKGNLVNEIGYEIVSKNPDLFMNSIKEFVNRENNKPDFYS